MPLTSNTSRDERYPGRGAGYTVAAGFHVYAMSLVGVNAAGALQPAGTAGVVAIVGVSKDELDNTAGTATDIITAWRGIWAIPVAAATPTNINGPVYAVDDTSATTSNANSAIQAGTLFSIESGVTWVKI